MVISRNKGNDKNNDGQTPTIPMKLEWGFGIHNYITIPGHSNVVSRVWENINNGKHSMVEKARVMKHASPSFTSCMTLDLKHHPFQLRFLLLQNEAKNLPLLYREFYISEEFL